METNCNRSWLKFLKYHFYSLKNQHGNSACVYVSQVLIPRQTGSQVDEQRLSRSLSQLDDTLDKLETMFLGRQPFLCGHDITLADLLAVCELMQVSRSTLHLIPDPLLASTGH